MNDQPVRMIVSELLLAVCRLGETAPIPNWAVQGAFFTVTRTGEELSVVCPDSLVPDGVRAERGWRAMRVAGVIDFSVIGVLAGLTAPLAESGISVSVISTYDTDYLLIRDRELGRAIETLQAAGYILEM